MASLGTVTYSRRSLYCMAREMGSSVPVAAITAWRNGPVTLAITAHDAGRREGDKCFVEISAKQV